MFNALWYVFFVPAYNLGIYIAASATVIAIGTGRPPGSNASVITLCVCFVYFALAFVVFGTVPKWLKKRLLRRVERVKGDEFFATWAIESTMLITYLGIDGPRERLLLVEITGMHREMSLDDISHWEVLQERRFTTLHIHTRLDDLPAFSLRIGQSKAQGCMAAMRRFIS